MNWIDLVAVEQLEEIKKESEVAPVIIFKHSTTCSISAMALARMQRASKTSNGKIYFLDLRAYRNVSNLVATAFDVQHESPQILIIDKGKSVYDRSHADINPPEIIEKFVTN
ncbi:MAG: bacillithiol system redox-active protein YtxJ [Bacteroidota bacterium]